MNDSVRHISFDRTKGPSIDFDLIHFEDILTKEGLDHDPKKLHRVEFYLLIIITSGTGVHTIDFKEYPLQAGSVLSIRKDQVHRFHTGSAKGFILLFTEEYLVSFLDKTGTDKISGFFNELLYYQHTLLEGTALHEVLILTNQIKQEYNQTLDTHTSGIIRNLLQVIISKISRVRNINMSIGIDHKYTHHFIQLQVLIESNEQQNRSVSYYAAQLNVTTKTLNNITQHVIQKPAKQFIDEIIILKIKRLLINTTLSVKEIAYQAGFDEPTNLFKFFKRYTLQTPEEFRSHFESKA